MKNKLFVILAFILGFTLWYFLVYQQELKQIIVGHFPRPGVMNEHVIWGMPIVSTATIFKYSGLVLGYNNDRKTPDWVSYHITDDYINGKKYLDKRKFKPDPNIEDENKVRTSDYTRSGYDRGHLAAQADMKGRDLLCESEACYLTNIAPQKPSFNRKTWLNLEKAVRKWTLKYNELWVITGSIYDSDHTYIKDKIEIPDAFYKIIVVKLDQTYGSNAFVIYQDDKTYNLEEYIVSIDSVESATGIDFFSELEDNLENKFESNINTIFTGWR
ncbi:MAG: DNA/RNA non-specific endonuclease [Candidatus Cloacimonetes bacterium]|jgi:endonuclease G|nr:DNA/RNA non-specific endonuclease [Candidatus Cloacimonadota bacterium]